MNDRSVTDPATPARTTPRKVLAKLSANEELNFLLTNRIPRLLTTRFIGWFSKVEQPLVRNLSIALWRLFSDLDLAEARTTRFRSMHECFTRELKPGARPIDSDPAVLVSPCDAIVGCGGRIADTALIQAKGFPYSLHDLLADEALIERFRDGCYVTLRITAAMYHRFHAPYDVEVDAVNYISGDTWNVNPVALKRVERLFCRNERAVVQMRAGSAQYPLVLVPVAAILVASIRLHFIDVLLHLKYRGPNRIACSARFAKGEEMGWFQHGSTIIVFAPPGFRLCEQLKEGSRIRMGEALMQLPEAAAQPSTT